MPFLKKCRAAKVRDTEYMDYICDRHLGFMKFLAGKYTSSHEDREDIVQEACIRLLRNEESLRRVPSEKIRKYIALTVRTVYLDMQKRRENLVIPVEDRVLAAMLSELEDDDPIHQEVAAKLSVELLKRELSPRDWGLLEGRYQLGLSWEELGAEAGVSPDSARMLLSRARKTAVSILTKADKKGGR